MDNQAAITLRPKVGYWVAKYIVIALISFLFPLVAMNLDLEPRIHYTLMGVFIAVWVLLLYTYLDMLLATEWIITKDELIFRHGLLSRREEHMELYRVIDYSEHRSLLQLLLGNKTVKVMSGDASDPVLYMYGIDNKILIIGILRDRVKAARKEYGIFEVANRN